MIVTIYSLPINSGSFCDQLPLPDSLFDELLLLPDSLFDELPLPAELNVGVILVTAVVGEMESTSIHNELI